MKKILMLALFGKQVFLNPKPKILKTEPQLFGPQISNLLWVLFRRQNPVRMWHLGWLKNLLFFKKKRKTHEGLSDIIGSEIDGKPTYCDPTKKNKQNAAFFGHRSALIGLIT
jgi:hypothetical protein